MILALPLFKVMLLSNFIQLERRQLKGGQNLTPKEQRPLKALLQATKAFRDLLFVLKC
jgi:hypothetical protein